MRIRVKCLFKSDKTLPVAEPMSAISEKVARPWVGYEGNTSEIDSTIGNAPTHKPKIMKTKTNTIFLFIVPPQLPKEILLSSAIAESSGQPPLAFLELRIDIQTIPGRPGVESLSFT
jgi:hypothetical protein